MNFKHDEERRNAYRKVKKFKINKETFEKHSKIRKKNETKRKRRKMFIRHLFSAK